MRVHRATRVCVRIWASVQGVRERAPRILSVEQSAGMKRRDECIANRYTYYI